MAAITNSIPQDGRFTKLRQSALSTERVSGLTHCHYKYPARFSPQFVAAAIDCFSEAGDVVLDPYMGGGTTILEALASERVAVGCDINSLAVFVARVKTTELHASAVKEVRTWATQIVPTLSYRDQMPTLQELHEIQTQNLHIPRARALKKLIALALAATDQMHSPKACEFARCAVLNVSQWALNGRKQATSSSDFRNRLARTTLEMLSASEHFQELVYKHPRSAAKPVLIHDSAENIATHAAFSGNTRADLVVTSPPYPGVHVLYHRWQVDGRRETSAPYWIANCLDGQGSAYYNFGARHQDGLHDYFAASLRTLHAIRAVMKNGGVIVQMIAFSDAESQLTRYLQNMELAGFSELRATDPRASRFWRNVPNRSWHASLQGRTKSSREVVLVHVAD